MKRKHYILILSLPHPKTLFSQLSPNNEILLTIFLKTEMSPQFDLDCIQYEPIQYETIFDGLTQDSYR